MQHVWFTIVPLKPVQSSGKCVVTLAWIVFCIIYRQKKSSSYFGIEGTIENNQFVKTWKWNSFWFYTVFMGTVGKRTKNCITSGMFCVFLKNKILFFSHFCDYIIIHFLSTHTYLLFHLTLFLFVRIYISVYNWSDTILTSTCTYIIVYIIVQKIYNNPKNKR